jgi:cytochrome c oxidase subunit 3
LGAIFTGFQIFEYINSPFSIRDRIFGTSFFVSTGFHGLHVLIGTLFLLFCLARSNNKEIVYSHHLGFEFAI